MFSSTLEVSDLFVPKNQRSGGLSIKDEDWADRCSKSIVFTSWIVFLKDQVATPKRRITARKKPTPTL